MQQDRLRDWLRNGHSSRCLGVRRSTLDEEDVDELATVFGVSSWVIEHQIAYHQIGRVQRSLDATGWPDSSALATTKVLRSKGAASAPTDSKVKDA